MTYLDDRATTARESGAREERARIANMGFFERRRYLNIHVAQIDQALKRECRARLLKGSVLYLSKKPNALFC